MKKKYTGKGTFVGNVLERGRKRNYGIAYGDS
jgi:hypothetical protein